MEIERVEIVLEHEGREIASLGRVDVEIVADKRGRISYLSLPPTIDNAKWLEELQKMIVD